MLTNLKIHTISLDIAEADKESNLRALEAALATLPQGTDLVILPELFTTGFIADREQASALAETSQGSTMQAIEQLAETHNCAICGSFLARSGPWLYNRAFFVEPSRECTFYDKRHLFSLSSEPQVMHRGESLPPVIRYRGWNIAIAVCYDLRFPVWLRNTGLKYDLLVIVANWPAKRQYQWTHLLIARAIENQAYVVGANRSGSDAYGTYSDLTFAFDYTGQLIAPTSTLSMAQLEKYRENFPFYKDAD